MRTILILILSTLPLLSHSALLPTLPSNPQVSLAWDASTDPRVSGYNLYFGVASRSYTNESPVGLTNTVTVALPARGVGTNSITYFFAVTATAPGGLESDFSGEVSFSPVSRLAPPNLHSPVVITVQVGLGVGGPWSDIFNVADYPATNQVYRLEIAQSLPVPGGVATAKLRALNALHAQLLRPSAP